MTVFSLSTPLPLGRTVALGNQDRTSVAHPFDNGGIVFGVATQTQLSIKRG